MATARPRKRTVIRRITIQLPRCQWRPMGITEPKIISPRLRQLGLYDAAPTETIAWIISASLPTMRLKPSTPRNGSDITDKIVETALADVEELRTTRYALPGLKFWLTRVLYRRAHRCPNVTPQPCTIRLSFAWTRRMVP